MSYHDQRAQQPTSTPSESNLCTLRDGPESSASTVPKRLASSRHICTSHDLTSLSAHLQLGRFITD